MSVGKPIQVISITYIKVAFLMSSVYQTFLITSFALIAFAANSVLCRLALGNTMIEPASFTIVRMLSGAITLMLVFFLLPDKSLYPFGDSSVLRSKTGRLIQLLKVIINNNQPHVWLAPSMLFTYAIFFSFAYTKLNTASGALILFASVQLCMLGSHLFLGYRFNKLEWSGIVISIAGFLLLMLPSATQPSFEGFLMMVIAGVAWAIYTLQGKTAENSIQNTTENFIRCIPFCLILFLFYADFSQTTIQGILLAILSGSIASGLGYAVWYIALRKLNITQAAISQLSVPLIAAIGGVLFVNESITLILVVSGILTLGGIGLINIGKMQ